LSRDYKTQKKIKQTKQQLKKFPTTRFEKKLYVHDGANKRNKVVSFLFCGNENEKSEQTRTLSSSSEKRLSNDVSTSPLAILPTVLILATCFVPNMICKRPSTLCHKLSDIMKCRLKVHLTFR
jgi:hypothetical protein